VSIERSAPATIAYTGHTRYVGKKIRARKGEDISASTLIHRGGTASVAVVTDANLHVLARDVEGPLTGSSNVSFAEADVVAPADGEYWVLFGEDSRMAIALEVSYDVLSRAGAACEADTDCIGRACVSGTCRVTPAFGLCVVDADCTSGRCNREGTGRGQCDPMPDNTCKLDGDCAKHVCMAGACSCVPAGHAPPAEFDEAFACCSQELDARHLCK
jgi:hypothetical protein